MSLAQFFVLLGLAVIVTPLAVLFIPRERQSAQFDRLLWAATLLVSFLGAWLALLFASQSSGPQTISAWRILDVPLAPPLVGAIAGALVLNIPLWIMDRFAQPLVEDDAPRDQVEEEGADAPMPGDNAAETHATENVKRDA